MLSMTTWIYVIKTLLKSEMRQQDIRHIIMNKCLFSQKKINGAYQVDDNKVWANIVLKDNGCKKKMEELNIVDVYGIYGYYEEICYKRMRGTFPRKYHKKGT